MDKIVKEFSNNEIIHSTIVAIKHIPREHVGIGISLLSKLVLNHDDEKSFAAQYVNF